MFNAIVQAISQLEKRERRRQSVKEELKEEEYVTLFFSGRNFINLTQPRTLCVATTKAKQHKENLLVLSQRQK